MAELIIPELAEVMQTQKAILQKLKHMEDNFTNFLSSKGKVQQDASDENKWLSRSEFRLVYRCGNDKINQLVKDKIVERDDSFGPRGAKFRWVKNSAIDIFAKNVVTSPL